MTIRTDANHTQKINRAINRAVLYGNKDYVDIYWYSLTERWPTQRERARMIKVEMIQYVPRGLKNRFPIGAEELNQGKAE